MSNSLWWHGPEWLTQSSSQWPEGNVPFITPALLQTIQEEREPTGTWVNVIQSLPLPQSALDETRFSSLTKLFRVTVYVFRFLKKNLECWDKCSMRYKCLMKLFAENSIMMLTFNQIGKRGPISSNEIKAVKTWWEYHIQRRFLHDVVTSLNNDKKHPLIRQLGLQFDDFGLIRCHGRLGRSDLPEHAKFPILLPRNNHFTSLVIQAMHVKLIHNGVLHTLSELRQNYWIPRGRVEVQKVIRNCCLCKKYTGGPYKYPDMAPLPFARVTRSLRPFQFVGVDYFGPLNVRDAYDSEKQKFWICLFTCSSTRAIHIEYVSDASAKCFLSCL
ncbi:MAG: hypothetical protein GY696_17090, partial [Gammaproteobacteria bacterium]|nr:hypothetical protein [Gammaproteobacteria bacterium]